MPRLHSLAPSPNSPCTRLGIFSPLFQLFIPSSSPFFFSSPSPSLPSPNSAVPTNESPNQEWTFKIIPKTATINALVSLSLDPATIDSDFIRVKYHKDQANDKDYSHEGVGFSFKKWQADQVAKHMDSPEVAAFEADRGAGKEAPRKYGSGTKEGDAPVKDF